MLFAQEHQVGFLPKINLNTKLGNTFTINNKIESRFTSRFQLLDLNALLSKSVRFNQKISLGYLYRLANSHNQQRFIQQFTIKNKKSRLTLTHRFVTDQTFRLNFTQGVYRLRYRISGQIPFSGNTLNHNEFYLKFSPEYLFIYDSKNIFHEFRTIWAVGRTVSKLNKLEFLIDNRIRTIENTNITSWFQIAWYRLIRR